MTSDKTDILIVFLTTSVFIGIILAFFLINLFIKEKRYRRLQKEKLIAEVRAAEQERNKIATQLHNDIGPFLSSVKMRLEIIDSNNLNDLNACKKVIDECIDQIRTMSNHLAAFNEIEFSLEEALINYIEHINAKKKLDIFFEMKEAVHLNNIQNTTIYRILQEIIQNTIKHANASLLKLEITKADNDLIIRTSDNGIGYDFKKVREQKKLGLGLLGIMTRVELLNGHLSQAPNTYPGTKYNITIPLNSHEKR